MFEFEPSSTLALIWPGLKAAATCLKQFFACTGDACFGKLLHCQCTVKITCSHHCMMTWQLKKITEKVSRNSMSWIFHDNVQVCCITCAKVASYTSFCHRMPLRQHFQKIAWPVQLKNCSCSHGLRYSGTQTPIWLQQCGCIYRLALFSTTFIQSRKKQQLSAWLNLKYLHA